MSDHKYIKLTPEILKRQLIREEASTGLHNELMKLKDELYDEYIDPLPITVESKHHLHNDLKEDLLMLWGFMDKTPEAFEVVPGGYDGLRRQVLEKFIFKVKKIKELILTEAKERLDELRTMQIEIENNDKHTNEKNLDLFSNKEMSPNKKLDLKILKPILTLKGKENINNIIPALQKINILNGNVPVSDGKHGLQRKINAFIDAAIETKINFIDSNKDLAITTLCLFLGVKKVKDQDYTSSEYLNEIKEIRELLQ